MRDSSVNSFRCYNNVYVNCFSSRIPRFYNFLAIECFRLTYDLNGFKSIINSTSYLQVLSKQISCMIFIFLHAFNGCSVLHRVNLD